MKLGILGGSFNPIHIGHLIIAEEVYNVHNLSKVIFIPVNLPPHKDANNLAKPIHRYNMVREAIGNLKYLEVSDIEIKRQGKSFTIDTIRLIQKAYGASSEIFLIIGADSVNELDAWKEIKSLSEMCKFIIINRLGYSVQNLENLEKILDKEKVSCIKNNMVYAPPIGISSTEIRKRLKNGQSIKFWTSPAVEDYIKKHKLYQD